MSGDDLWLTTPTNTSVNPYRDVLTSPRSESFRWDVLDLNSVLIDRLDGVEPGARFDFSVFNTIRGGGSLTWSGKAGAQPDWDHVQLQPWYTVTTDLGVQSWPLGVFIPAAPLTKWGDTGQSVPVQLFDRLLLLDQDKVTRTFSLPVGSWVASVIFGLIRFGYGGRGVRLDLADSHEVTRSPMVWEAGTSKLSIVNDLLAAINFFSLRCDGFGAYHSEPYVAPTGRGLGWDFGDDAAGITDPAFDHEHDLFDVPNRVVLVGRAEGDLPPLVATAENTDPNSRTSYLSRRRWIVYTETGVEATSQAVLDGLAARKLRDLSTPSSALTISHAPIPLDLNDAVTFRRGPAGLDLLAVVQSMTVTFDVGALTQTKLLEVAR